MNTPKPCNECNHLYWDVMHEDDPASSAECKKGYELAQCPWAKKLAENGITPEEARTLNRGEY